MESRSGKGKRGLPAEDLAPAIELFRHRFLQALRHGKHISPSRLADLFSWKHSGFNIHDGGEKPSPPKGKQTVRYYGLCSNKPEVKHL